MAELLNVVQKKQNGGRRHLELLFRNRGPTTKSTSWPEHCVKISCQSRYYCRRYGHLNIWQIALKHLFPPPKFTFLGVLPPKHHFSSLRPSKGTSLGECASFKVQIVKNRPPVFCCRRRQEKKERKGKVHKVTSRLYFTNMGSRPLRPISTEIGKVVGVHDVINHSKFGFNIFRGFRSTGGQSFRFPFDFAGHRYNSAAATAQPVISRRQLT